MRKYFKIKQIKKIKLFANAFSFIMILSLVGIFLAFIFFMPTKRSSGEVRTLLFIRLYPVWLQYFIMYSLIIFPLSMILYSISNYFEKGIIYFDLDKIRIKTFRKNISIEVRHLINIIFVDQTNFLNTEFSYRFILQTSLGKVYRLQLLERERMDELIETIQFYKTASDRLKISAELTDPTNEFEDSN